MVGLASKGIPWSVIESWDRSTRLGVLIIIAETHSGKTFDFETLKFEGEKSDDDG